MDKPTNRIVENGIKDFMQPLKMPEEVKKILSDGIKSICELAYIGGQMNQSDHDLREFKKVLGRTK